jgi:hypothetical protein
MIKQARTISFILLAASLVLAFDRGVVANTHACIALNCSGGFECAPDWFTCTGCPQTENWCENTFETGCRLYCTPEEMDDVSFCGSGAVYCVCENPLGCVED